MVSLATFSDRALGYLCGHLSPVIVRKLLHFFHVFPFLLHVLVIVYHGKPFDQQECRKEHKDKEPQQDVYGICVWILVGSIRGRVVVMGCAGSRVVFLSALAGVGECYQCISQQGHHDHGQSEGPTPRCYVFFFWFVFSESMCSGQRFQQFSFVHGTVPFSVPHPPLVSIHSSSPGTMHGCCFWRQHVPSERLVAYFALCVTFFVAPSLHAATMHVFHASAAAARCVHVFALSYVLADATFFRSVLFLFFFLFRFVSFVWPRGVARRRGRGTDGFFVRFPCMARFFFFFW